VKGREMTAAEALRPPFRPSHRLAWINSSLEAES